MSVSDLKSLLKQESTGGILLMGVTIMALAMANSPLSEFYFSLKQHSFQVGFEGASLKKSLSHWVNDGLMTFFFLLVGLEIKREIKEGELSDRKKAALPVLAALGGVVLPALIYLGLNFQAPHSLKGWAIPCATDIAFALAILTLLGKRTPGALKVFLLSIAIIDDLAAILIIALFYSGPLNFVALASAGALTGILFLMNQRGLKNLGLYLGVGLLLWLAFLKSGLHATLAGVILAFSIPMAESTKQSGTAPRCPLKTLEHALHPWVTFLIMPLFAFMNAGLVFNTVSWADLTSPLSQGIKGGLLLGKPVGVLLAAWLGVKSGLARLPTAVGWPHVLGVGFLTGIGFTMSLFIGGMAFPDPPELLQVKLSVLVASTLSALIGFVFLKRLAARS